VDGWRNRARRSADRRRRSNPCRFSVARRRCSARGTPLVNWTNRCNRDLQCNASINAEVGVRAPLMASPTRILGSGGAKSADASWVACSNHMGTFGYQKNRHSSCPILVCRPPGLPASGHVTLIGLVVLPPLREIIFPNPARPHSVRLWSPTTQAGVTDFGPDRRSSFDRLRMSGYLFPLMVSL
jgi:hypothetical protein